jgi:hypothetical protein
LNSLWAQQVIRGFRDAVVVGKWEGENLQDRSSEPHGEHDPNLTQSFPRSPSCDTE